MQISKKALFPAIFIVIFILINMLLSYLLRPFSGSGAEMWRGFTQKEKIDMVYTGSSFCICGIDPIYVDEKTGLTSYNMGTNMQSLQNSYLAIQHAVKEKNATSAVLVIDPDVVEMVRKENFRAEQCFYRNLSDTQPFSQKIKTDLSFVFGRDFILSSSSLGYLFPWTYDRDADIENNIYEKKIKDITAHAEHRDENGYLGSYEVVSLTKEITEFEDASKRSLELGTLPVIEPLEDNIRTLNEIGQFCADYNVKLYVISVPSRTVFTDYDFEGYMAFNKTIDDLFGEYGADYYDFNLLKKEYFDQTDKSLFRDNTHMNSVGASIFSSLLGEMMVKLESNEDVSFYFYER